MIAKPRTFTTAPICQAGHVFIVPDNLFCILRQAYSRRASDASAFRSRHVLLPGPRSVLYSALLEKRFPFLTLIELLPLVNAKNIIILPLSIALDEKELSRAIYHEEFHARYRALSLKQVRKLEDRYRRVIEEGIEEASRVRLALRQTYPELLCSRKERKFISEFWSYTIWFVRHELSHAEAADLKAMLAGDEDTLQLVNLLDSAAESSRKELVQCVEENCRGLSSAESTVTDRTTALTRDEIDLVKKTYVVPLVEELLGDKDLVQTIYAQLSLLQSKSVLDMLRKGHTSGKPWNEILTSIKDWIRSNVD